MTSITTFLDIFKVTNDYNDNINSHLSSCSHSVISMIVETEKIYIKRCPEFFFCVLKRVSGSFGVSFREKDEIKKEL